MKYVAYCLALAVIAYGMTATVIFTVTGKGR